MTQRQLDGSLHGYQQAPSQLVAQGGHLMPLQPGVQTILQPNMAPHSQGMRSQIPTASLHESTSITEHMLPSNRRFVTRIPTQHLELASLQSRHGDLTTLAPCDFNLPADSTIPAPALPQHSLPVASRHPSVQEPYEKRELCPYCSKSFTTRQEMLVHQWSHTDRKSLFECHLCDKSFVNENLFKKHNMIHQREESKSVTCQTCKKVLRNHRALEQHHLSEHHGEKSHRCKTCGIEYSWRENLIRHEQIHKDRPHVCRFCKKSFANVDQLFQHQRTHMREINVTQSYNTTSALKASNSTAGKTRDREMQDNAELMRPYKCMVCDKSFQYTFSLDAHMKAHQDVNIPVTKGSADLLGSAAVTRPGHYLEKQHVCQVCNAAFQYPFSLDAHMKTHQSPMPIVKQAKKKKRSYLRRTAPKSTPTPNTVVTVYKKQDNTIVPVSSRILNPTSTSLTSTTVSLHGSGNTQTVGSTGPQPVSCSQLDSLPSDVPGVLEQCCGGPVMKSLAHSDGLDTGSVISEALRVHDGLYDGSSNMEPNSLESQNSSQLSSVEHSSSHVSGIAQNSSQVLNNAQSNLQAPNVVQSSSHSQSHKQYNQASNAVHLINSKNNNHCQSSQNLTNPLLPLPQVPAVGRNNIDQSSESGGSTSTQCLPIALEPTKSLPLQSVVQKDSKFTSQEDKLRKRQVRSKTRCFPSRLGTHMEPVNVTVVHSSQANKQSSSTERVGSDTIVTADAGGRRFVTRMQTSEPEKSEDVRDSAKAGPVQGNRTYNKTGDATSEYNEQPEAIAIDSQFCESESGIEKLPAPHIDDEPVKLTEPHVEDNKLNESHPCEIQPPVHITDTMPSEVEPFGNINDIASCEIQPLPHITDISPCDIQSSIHPHGSEPCEIAVETHSTNLDDSDIQNSETITEAVIEVAVKCNENDTDLSMTSSENLCLQNSNVVDCRQGDMSELVDLHEELVLRTEHTELQHRAQSIDPVYRASNGSMTEDTSCIITEGLLSSLSAAKQLETDRSISVNTQSSLKKGKSKKKKKRKDKKKSKDGDKDKSKSKSEKRKKNKRKETAIVGEGSVKKKSKRSKKSHPSKTSKRLKSKDKCKKSAASVVENSDGNLLKSHGTKGDVQSGNSTVGHHNVGMDQHVAIPTELVTEQAELPNVEMTIDKTISVIQETNDNSIQNTMATGAIDRFDISTPVEDAAKTNDEPSAISHVISEDLDPLKCESHLIKDLTNTPEAIHEISNNLKSFTHELIKSPEVANPGEEVIPDRLDDPNLIAIKKQPSIVDQHQASTCEVESKINNKNVSESSTESPKSRPDVSESRADLELKVLPVAEAASQVAEPQSEMDSNSQQKAEVEPQPVAISESRTEETECDSRTQEREVDSRPQPGPKYRLESMQESQVEVETESQPESILESRSEAELVDRLDVQTLNVDAIPVKEERDTSSPPPEVVVLNTSVEPDPVCSYSDQPVEVQCTEPSEIDANFYNGTMETTEDTGLYPELSRDITLEALQATMTRCPDEARTGINKRQNKVKSKMVNDSDGCKKLNRGRRLKRCGRMVSDMNVLMVIEAEPAANITDDLSTDKDEMVVNAPNECKQLQTDTPDESPTMKPPALNNSLYECQFCDDSFVNEVLFQRHITAHKLERTETVNCTKCKKVLRDGTALRRHHFIEHVNKESRQCKTCGIQFVWRENLIRHEEEHKSLGNVDGDDHGIPGKKDQKDHKSMDEKAQENQVDKGHKDDDSEIQHHIDQIVKDRKLSPRLNSTSGRNRKTAQSKDSCDSWECEMCGEMFKLQLDLQSHMKSHCNKSKTHLNSKGCAVFTKAASDINLPPEEMPQPEIPGNVDDPTEGADCIPMITNINADSLKKSETGQEPVADVVANVDRKPNSKKSKVRKRKCNKSKHRDSEKSNPVKQSVTDSGNIEECDIEECDIEECDIKHSAENKDTEVVIGEIYTVPTLNAEDHIKHATTDVEEKVPNVIQTNELGKEPLSEAKPADLDSCKGSKKVTVEQDAIGSNSGMTSKKILQQKRSVTDPRMKLSEVNLKQLCARKCFVLVDDIKHSENKCVPVCTNKTDDSSVETQRKTSHNRSFRRKRSIDNDDAENLIQPHTKTVRLTRKAAKAAMTLEAEGSGSLTPVDVVQDQKGPKVCSHGDTEAHEDLSLEESSAKVHNQESLLNVEESKTDNGNTEGKSSVSQVSNTDRMSDDVVPVQDLGESETSVDTPDVADSDGTFRSCDIVGSLDTNAPAVSNEPSSVADDAAQYDCASTVKKCSTSNVPAESLNEATCDAVEEDLGKLPTKLRRGRSRKTAKTDKNLDESVNENQQLSNNGVCHVDTAKVTPKLTSDVCKNKRKRRTPMKRSPMKRACANTLLTGNEFIYKYTTVCYNKYLDYLNEFNTIDNDFFDDLENYQSKISKLSSASFIDNNVSSGGIANVGSVYKEPLKSSLKRKHGKQCGSEKKRVKWNNEQLEIIEIFDRDTVIPRGKKKCLHVVGTESVAKKKQGTVRSKQYANKKPHKMTPRKVGRPRKVPSGKQPVSKLRRKPLDKRPVPKKNVKCSKKPVNKQNTDNVVTQNEGPKNIPLDIGVHCNDDHAVLKKHTDGVSNVVEHNVEAEQGLVEQLGLVEQQGLVEQLHVTPSVRDVSTVVELSNERTVQDIVPSSRDLASPDEEPSCVLENSDPASSAELKSMLIAPPSDTVSLGSDPTRRSTRPKQVNRLLEDFVNTEDLSLDSSVTSDSADDDVNTIK